MRRDSGAASGRKGGAGGCDCEIGERISVVPSPKAVQMWSSKLNAVWRSSWADVVARRHGEREEARVLAAHAETASLLPSCDNTSLLCYEWLQDNGSCRLHVTMLV